MVNREDEIFTLLHDKIKEDYPNLEIANEAILSPSIFPFVYITEINNREIYRDRTLTNLGDRSRVAYEVTVYDTQTGSAKRLCRDVMSKADDVFRTVLCFQRDSMVNFIDENLNVNKTVARYTGQINNAQKII